MPFTPYIAGDQETALTLCMNTQIGHVTSRIQWK